MEMKYTNAIANVIGTAWLSYTATIKVAGMPWYPAFAACRPRSRRRRRTCRCPVTALTQVPVSISASVMKEQMVGMLGDPKAPFHDELFEAICDAFDKCFKIWQGVDDGDERARHRSGPDVRAAVRARRSRRRRRRHHDARRIHLNASRNARLGDKSNVPADAHGCPACPHPCVGPAIVGSPDVNVNNLPAMRVDDTGIHAACCGPNTWSAKAGSGTVFINNKAAHRLGDRQALRRHGPDDRGLGQRHHRRLTPILASSA